MQGPAFRRGIMLILIEKHKNAMAFVYATSGKKRARWANQGVSGFQQNGL